MKLKLLTVAISLLAAASAHAGWRYGHHHGHHHGHPPPHAVATPQLDQRQAHQQQLIRHGIVSGQITPHEASRLHQQQHHIAACKAAATRDGFVTGAEYANLMRELDHAERAIALALNNPRHRHGHGYGHGHGHVHGAPGHWARY